MLRTGQLLHPASSTASQPNPEASLPGTLASPRTGLSPAGCQELVARLRHFLLLCSHGARATGRTRIEAQGYLDCQNILSGLGKQNRERLEAACQELVNRRGHPTYTTLKRIMAGIDSDAKKPRPVVPAASTHKRHDTSGVGPDVFVRDVSHYEVGGEGSR